MTNGSKIPFGNCAARRSLSCTVGLTLGPSCQICTCHRQPSSHPHAHYMHHILVLSNTLRLPAASVGSTTHSSAASCTMLSKIAKCVSSLPYLLIFSGQKSSCGIIFRTKGVYTGLKLFLNYGYTLQYGTVIISGYS